MSIRLFSLLITRIHAALTQTWVQIFHKEDFDVVILVRRISTEVVSEEQWIARAYGQENDRHQQLP